MNQEFVVGIVKLIQDEQGYGIAVKKEEEWDCIATFKYSMDAVSYFNNLVVTLGLPDEKDS